MKFAKFACRLLAVAVLAWAGIASAQESVRFGPAVRADSAQLSKNLLPLSAAQPPRELAAGAEVVLISGYEPSDKSSVGTTVKVKVDRPGARVLLLLSSYEAVNWQVTASPGTTIAGIIASGYHPPTVMTMAKTRGYQARLPYAYETDNIRFKEILTRLNALFGVDRLDVFRGSYRIPSVISITAVDAPRPELTVAGPMPKRPSVDVAFDLIASDFSKVRWTLVGPADQVEKAYLGEGKIALSDSGRFIYKLIDDHLEIVNRAGGQRFVAALPPNFPRFSWPMDVAFDSKRNIVSVVTLGGEGFLYRLDAKRREWIDFRSLNNIDIFSLAYDPVKDRYVAWTDQGSLLFISGDGDALFEKKVRPLLQGFGRLYDRGNGRPPRITIAPSGDDLALVYIGGNSVKRIWHYNVRTENAELTY